MPNTYTDSSLSTLTNAQYKSLLASPLLRGLTEDELTHFISSLKLTPRTYPKDSFIAITGEPMEGIGVILSGRALLTRENVLGQRTIMTELMPSSMFGEALLFTDAPLWPATIQTTKETAVLFFPLKAFTHDLNSDEPARVRILTNLLHDMSEKALTLTRKVHYLSLKGMRERIFAYFSDLYKKQKTNPFMLPVNRQELPEILNVSRTSMRRELGRLQDEGILQMDGRQVTVLKPDEVTEYGF